MIFISYDKILGCILEPVSQMITFKRFKYYIHNMGGSLRKYSDSGCIRYLIENVHDRRSRSSGELNSIRDCKYVPSRALLSDSLVAIYVLRPKTYHGRIVTHRVASLCWTYGPLSLTQPKRTSKQINVRRRIDTTCMTTCLNGKIINLSTLTFMTL